VLLEDYPAPLRQARAVWRLVAWLVACLVLIAIGAAYLVIGHTAGRVIGGALVVAAVVIAATRVRRYGRVIWPDRFGKPA